MASPRQPPSTASATKNKLNASGNQLPAALPSLTSPQAPVVSWRDHPLVVAALAVAGTIGLMILVVKEIILPTYMTSLQNQLQEIPKLQVEKAAAEQFAKTAEKVLKDMEQQLKEKDAKITALMTKIANAEASNLFTKGTPYPVSLGKVTVGMPIAEVEKVFPPSSIKKDQEGYWAIEDQHGVFGQITYYFDEEDKVRKITHVAFRKHYQTAKSSKVDLQEKMVEAFGQPTPYSKPNLFSWKFSSGHTIYKSSEDYYLLMSSKDIPLIWPKK